MENYVKLRGVLEQAYTQAAEGKGAERHANKKPFEQQPMQQISCMLGSTDGMAFQAIKKIQEAKRMPAKEARIREYLGAINYIAGIVVYEEMNS